MLSPARGMATDPDAAVRAAREFFTTRTVAETLAGFRPGRRTPAETVPLAEALRALEAVVLPPERFDPTTSRYMVSIAMPDLLAPLASRLVAGLTSAAPLLHVRLSHVVPSLSEALARGEPALALAPSRFVAS